MIKAVESQYREGRKRGDWWKWNGFPMTVDAVLLYANRGSGRTGKPLQRLHLCCMVFR